MSDIGELILGYRGAKTLFTSVRLGIFEAIGARRRTAPQVARALRLSGRSTRILLDGLCALGFLRRSPFGYSNSEQAKRLLLPSSPAYLGDNLLYQDRLWEAWGGLGDAVRNGRPARGLKAWISGEDGFTGDYIRGMNNIARSPAERIASKIRCSPGSSLLDVGAGPGAYAAAFLKKTPGMRAVLLDLPQTLRHTRRLMLEQPPGLRSRVGYRAGDYRRCGYGRGEFDLVLLSHVTHDEDEAAVRSMLRKARAALKSGGRLLIHDFMLNSNRTAPVFGALFSVHMMVYTRGGRVYSEQEYGRWLRAAGFKHPRRFEVPTGSCNGTTLLVCSRN